MKSPNNTRWLTVAWGSLAATLLVWLADAAGAAVPAWPARLLVSWTAIWLAAGLVGRVRRGLSAESREERLATWSLIALVGISLVARYVGLAFELTTHFHNDEGIFLKIGRQIVEGEQLLPTQFHYPHLLYYLSAFTLWLGELFPQVSAWVAGAIFGVAAEDAAPLLLRLTSATLSALTAVPVFLAARRAAGLWAGLFAGGLIALSPTYNEVSQLAISDVPSGFFAALTLVFVARLLDGEKLDAYLLAGVSAALAAASKYPAGVVAVAIIGIWIYWRIRKRDFNLLLLWSGLASIATLLAVMPALWLRFDSVFNHSQGADILFGYRQYAGKGWIGVVADSNVAYYSQGVLGAFGVLAVAFGIVGLFFLPARERRRTFALAVFPVLFLALLFTMNVVVKRNMQPLLPAAAVVLGAGLAAWPPRLGRPTGAWKVALLTGLFLAQPAFGTVAWDISRVRPGTRQLALEWIDANVPQGASFIKEAYTPGLHFRRHTWRQSRYAARLTLEEIRDPRWDYLFLARNAHVRFLDPDRRLYPHHEVFAERYRRLFDELELVARFQPGTFRSGPDLLLYRLDPPEVRYVEGRLFSVADVGYVSDPALKPKAGAEAISFGRKGQSVVFKEHFIDGRYRAVVNQQPAGVEAWLYVVSRDNREVGEFTLGPEGVEIALDRPDKYFFRVFLSPGGELSSLEVTPANTD